MDDQTPQKAAKFFKEHYPEWIQKLARMRFFQHKSIIHSRSGHVTIDYRDLATAREAASAVERLRVMHPDIRFKWNKKELQRLFNNPSGKRQLKN
jgi:hypothetical protein